MVIRGEKRLKRPSKKWVRDEKKVNLIVDIQAKLLAGKGPGYERWAKVFNLKQMAKTLNYLEENHITSLDELEKKVKEVNREFQEVSSWLTEIERQMKENRELQKHIVNYAKTREVYLEYRKLEVKKKETYMKYGKVNQEKRNLKTVELNVRALLETKNHNSFEITKQEKIEKEK